MFTAFGWVKIQTSIADYQGASLEEVDALDDRFDLENKKLYQELNDWLNLNETAWIKWQFTEHLNNESGILQFHASRNHRTSVVWRLMKFITEQSLGSYGAIYIQDDEDIDRVQSHDFSLSFRVWRILNGEMTEHDDMLFSPFSSPHAFDILSDQK